MTNILGKFYSIKRGHSRRGTRLYISSWKFQSVTTLFQFGLQVNSSCSLYLMSISLISTICYLKAYKTKEKWSTACAIQHTIFYIVHWHSKPIIIQNLQKGMYIIISWPIEIISQWCVKKVSEVVRTVVFLQPKHTQIQNRLMESNFFKVLSFTYPQISLKNLSEVPVTWQFSQQTASGLLFF